MAATITLTEFLSSLADLRRLAREDAAMQQQIAALVRALGEIGVPTRENLTAFVISQPAAVPILANCAGLTQEQLKNQLAHRLGTSSWNKLVRTMPSELISMLDDEFRLVPLLTEQLNRQWSFSDVLLERYLWSRRSAANAVGQGRNVEDEVEGVVKRLGLAFQPRTRFLGRGGETGPCDLAIPAGGEMAQIVIAMKGFNSTGSKLSDAVREVEAMASSGVPINTYLSFWMGSDGKVGKPISNVSTTSGKNSR